MASYTIENPENGRKYAIELQGDTPPTAEQMRKIFERDLIDNPMPEPEPTALERTGDLAMEFVAGVNRPIASMLDIAVSPIALAADALGIPFVNFRQKVGEKGQFAGDSLATDVVSATGEVSSIAIPFGMATRATGEMLSSLTVAEDSTLLRETLRRIGDIFKTTTPKSDVLTGAAAGFGGELAAEGGGAIGEFTGVLLGDAETGRLYGEEAGRMTGQLITPVAAARLLSRPRNLLNSFVQKTLQKNVNPAELKGAGHILYEDTKKFGAYYTDDSLQQLATDLEKAALDANIFGVGTQSTISSRLKNLLNNFRKGGDYSGTTVAYMMDAVQTFQGLRASQDSNISRQAGKISDVLEDFFYNKAVLGGFGRQPIVEPTQISRTVQPGESLPVQAQPIGQQVGRPRAGAAEDIIEGEFTVTYKTTPGTRFNDIGPTQQELPRAIEQNYRQAGQFWRRARVLEDLNEIFTTSQVTAGAVRSQENVVDLQIKKLVDLRNDPSRFRRLSAQEQQALDDAISSRGSGKKFFTALENLGLSSTDGVKARLFYTLGGLAGAGASGYYGSGAGMVAGTSIAAAGTIASMSRQITNRIVQRDINYLKSLVAAGPNGEDIVKLYMSRTPKSERNAEELGALLLSNNADLIDLNKSRVISNKLVETASAIAAIGAAELDNLQQ